jgi:outer membrane protein OmpA-like peptidoglycan-associated protein
MRRLALALILAFAPSAAARAADVAGSKDPPNFKRFAGSEIIHYKTSPYDQYIMARGPGSAEAGGFAKSQTVEGAITRLVYRVPVGHTALELLRNYEQMLSAAGFTQTFELAPCGGQDIGPVFLGKYWWQNAGMAGDQSPFQSGMDCYFTASATQNGQDVNVAVLVSALQDRGSLNWPHPGQKDQISVNLGEVLVGVDVVAAKAVEINMVVVQAADIADALAAKGTFDLYGILFDVDRTDIKPESAKTLDQVAALLKIDRSLKLEISGHTDNSGEAAHNMTLSQGRAQAVVDALVKQYGINPGRLQAKGYGDTEPVAPNDTDANKAKNRRVELKKV